ncbi:MAG: exodeoxyribonuclease VII small subunit [Gemmataceae bacterium]
MSEVPFEKALAELEAVVRDLEDGRLGLDDALARYERGVGLIQTCQSRLQAAEQRILLLTGLDEAGDPATQPFRHTRTDGRRG